MKNIIFIILSASFILSSPLFKESEFDLASVANTTPSTTNKRFLFSALDRDSNFSGRGCCSHHGGQSYCGSK